MGDLLAILGGVPARFAALPTWPVRGPEEEQALLRALHQDGWWRSQGAEVASFEKALAERNAVPHALAVANGTNALELALQAHQVSSESDVIVPAVTFISTLSAVVRLGARPVLVDCDARTWNLDVARTLDRVNGRTRAIVPVHLGGVPADLLALTRLIQDRQIPLVQDAAHANGATLDGRPVASYGDSTCFSFQNAKLITAGEGGAVAFTDPEIHNRAYLYHNCGRPAGDTSYNHSVFGSNYRMNEFTAAILSAQLGRFDSQHRRRAENYALLAAALNDVDGIELQGSTASAESSHYFVGMKLARELSTALSRDWFVHALRAEGVPASPVYLPLFETPAFRTLIGSESAVRAIADQCPNAADLGRRGVVLSHTVLLGGHDLVEQVAVAIAKVARYAVAQA